MARRTVTTLFLIFLGADISLAGPKDDCTPAVGHLGFPTNRYSFVEAGIFAKERHVFDDVINCYISSDGKIHSITRGNTTLMEDGYYGPEALAKRSEIEAHGRALDAEAYKAYQDASEQIQQNTERDLEALRRSSSPLATAPQKNYRKFRENPPAAAEPEPEPEPEPVVAPEPEPSPQPEPVSVKEMWSTAERLTIRTCPLDTMWGNRLDNRWY